MVTNEIADAFLRQAELIERILDTLKAIEANDEELRRIVNERV